MKFRIPKYVRKFLLKMGILMLIFTLCRLLFYARNAASFPDAGFFDFLVGFWFDLISTCLLFLPLILLELFPNKNRKAKWFVWSTTALTFIIFLFAIGVNLVDVEFYSYASSRASSSLFVMLGFGNDLSSQLPSFMKDYWDLLLFLIGFMAISFWLILKSNKKEDDSPSTPLWIQSIICVLGLGLTILIARGGFVSKPVRTTEASKYVDSKNAQLVLNSAFTVINSWGAETLEEKSYMSEDDAKRIFYPVHQYDSNGRLKGHNVVLLILESFSIEYIASLNIDNGDFTPFFDQLVDSSLVFENAFANGKKSIDAVPSILASIPKMMHDEYMLTPYATNSVESLPSILGSVGYETAFYHGATNGSMNFDAFCSQIDFDNYYGRNEYGNDDHYDGTWGIPDHYFMDWSVDQFSMMKEPFFSTLFTISSHPPHDIPQEFDEKFNAIQEEDNRSVRYTDYALEQFFIKARQQSWYKNTLFVLTADHTSSSNGEIYSTDRGRLHIPLIFFHPTDTTLQSREKRTVGHIDIMPTILDLLGYNDEFFSFGHSVFEDNPGYTFSQIAGKNYLFETFEGEPYLLIFENEECVAIYHLSDLYQNTNLINTKPALRDHLERRIKAIIQVYNDVLIFNKMSASEYDS